MKIVSEKNSDVLDLAVESLLLGKAISFACDTVYGIAVDASNSQAVDGLYRLKKRDKNKPIAVFLSDLSQAKSLFYFDKITEEFAQKFLPGSVTLVLKTKPEAQEILASNLNQNQDGFLGFRIIENSFIQNLLKKFGGILAVTSANISSQKDAVCAKEVEEYFANSELDLLVDGGVSEAKTSSTVVKIADEKVSILRQGATNIF